MARMTALFNGILPCQEAFLVDAPTPEASPRRWIQAKPESTDGLVGSTVWGRVAAGLVRVCGPERFGACRTGVRGWCGWWRVGFGCAARGAQRRVR